MSFAWFSTSTLLYLFFTYVRLNFFNIKSFLTSKDFMVKSNLLTTNIYTNLYKFYTTLFLITLVATQQYTQYSELFTTFLTININFLSIGILFLLFVVLTFSVNSAHPHHAPLVLIFTTLSLLALSVSNIYQLYLIFELTAYTNLLFLSTYRLNIFDKNKQHLVAIIISFVLNFIASILFFVFMVLITWAYTYPTWTSLVLFDSSGIISVALTIGILVKLGVGPWLSGNYHTYAGYNLLYLIVYTINIVLIITPILLWLYLNFGNSMVLTLVLISLILYISGTLHTVKSVKSLFAYSTVIVYFYLFLICLI